MPAYRATFFFESLEQADIGTGAAIGWTESWYRDWNVPIDQAIVDPQLDEYVRLRRAFMPDIYRVSFLRVSQDDQPRRFKVRNVVGGLGAVASSVSQPGVFAAQVQCAILLDLEKLPAVDVPTEKVHHRRFLVRGLPNDLIRGNVIRPFGAQWPDFINFADYVGNVRAGQGRAPGIGRFSWGMRYHTPTLVPTGISTAGPSAANDRTLLVTTINPIAPVLGERWLVAGIDSPRNFNRVWTFITDTVIAGVTYHAFGTSRQKLQGVYNGPGPGRIAQVGFRYGPVDQYAVIGLRNKRTGRVFRQLRGRSARR